ncbi:MAG: 16S rRNA methyltransferase [Candidatus Thermoplasmatota archaeon]|nr:16S rRNA methyltransferase [Candidatus Thermoplasmatota archaeon]
MLTLFLVDAELELVPELLLGHRAVSAPAKQRGKRTSRTLLDASKHHHAMREKNLPEADRRGRPDITHVTLLTALDAALNLEGGLKVRVHTRNDELLTIRPETRIMRNQERFQGLIEKLFEEGQVGPRDKPPLMTLEPKTPLKTALAWEQPDHVIALSPEGEPTAPFDAFPRVADAHDHVAILLGGFPRGDYKSPVAELADETWALAERPLSAWVAAAEVLVAWRHTTRGMAKHRAAPPQT